MLTSRRWLLFTEVIWKYMQWNCKEIELQAKNVHIDPIKPSTTCKTSFLYELQFSTASACYAFFLFEFDQKAIFSSFCIVFCLFWLVIDSVIKRADWFNAFPPLLPSILYNPWWLKFSSTPHWTRLYCKLVLTNFASFFKKPILFLTLRASILRCTLEACLRKILLLHYLFALEPAHMENVFLAFP